MASVNTKRTQETEENDLYNTPSIALESFYDQYPEVFDDYYTYYDPCNGLGAISGFLESIGKEVYKADLVDYKQKDVSLLNFLETETIPDDVECIIMNPPFKMTEEFVDKALSFNKPVIMFNRMVTIESKSRANKFKSGVWPLWNMWQFGFRVSCTKGVKKEPTANSVAYSWFEFRKMSKPTGKTCLRWII